MFICINFELSFNVILEFAVSTYRHQETQCLIVEILMVSALINGFLTSETRYFVHL